MKNDCFSVYLIAAGALGLSACAAAGDGAGDPGGQEMTGATMPPPASVPPPAVTPPAAVGGAGATATPIGGNSSVGAAGAGAAGAAGAGSGGASGAAGGSGGAGGSGIDPNAMPADDSHLPIIPPLNGECPDFTTGTKTVNGLRGISFQVGAKKEGPPTGPLVFYWHGTGSSSFEGSSFPGISEILDQGGVFVAFSGSLGTGGDCSGTGTFSQDDFKVADQIVACAVQNHNIDARRIYATGCSAGGLFAGCMGIERSSYLAATVPNSGGVTIGYGPIQDPKRMPAVMTMHGGPGDVVIVTFSETSKAYDTLMVRNGSPIVINCDHGGGHCGAPGSLYESGWQFMKDHPFGTKPSPYMAGLPAGFHSSCEITTDAMGMLPFGGDPKGEPKTPVTGEVWTPPAP